MLFLFLALLAKLPTMPPNERIFWTFVIGVVNILASLVGPKTSLRDIYQHTGLFPYCIAAITFIMSLVYNPATRSIVGVEYLAIFISFYVPVTYLLGTTRDRITSRISKRHL